MNTTVIDAPPVTMQAQQASTGDLVAQAPGALVGAAGHLPARQPTVIEAAIKAGASAAELREILALQRDLDNHQLALMREKRAMDEEDRKRAAELAFARDFAAFRGEAIVIPKTKEVDRGKAGSFVQAEYGVASTMLSPALSSHGFSFRHDMKFASKRWMTDGAESDVPWVYVTTYLTHRDGHTEVLDLEGPPGDLHANTPVQNMQATGSYLKRQGLLAITGTATQDEDNENRIGNRLPAARRRQDSPEAQEADDALVDTGRAEAMKGMAALTAWWATLTPRQQKDLGTEFLQMRKAARRADEDNARNPQQGEAHE